MTILKIKRLFETVMAVMLASSIGLYAGGDKIQPKSDPIEVNTIGSYYVGMGLNFFYLKDHATKETLSTPKVLTMIAGYQLNDYFSLEGRYYRSVGSIHYDAGATLSPDAEYNSVFTDTALFVKAIYPFEQDKINIYTLLGYGRLTLSNIANADRETYSIQYGAGVSYKISDSFILSGDWIHAYDDKGFACRALDERVSVNLFTLSLSYHF
jgi:opacity protein-like surface antigen